MRRNKLLYLIVILLSLYLPISATEYSGSYALPNSYTYSETFRTGTPYQKAKDIVNSRKIDYLRSSNPQGWVDSVAKEISSYSKDEFVRTKMAHDVTALLLHYDAANYWAGTTPSQTLSYILKTKTAVCEGYANLFKALCNALGMSCEKVHGYARGVGYSNGSRENTNNSNHAWNIVKVSGSWYLVDCCWDSGSMDGRIFKQQYETTWLFARPEYFVCTHYPTDSAVCQLMPRQITSQGFLSLAAFRPNLADVADLISYPKKENRIGKCCVISYRLKNGGSLSFNVYDSNGNTIWCTFSDTSNGVTKTLIYPPQKGTYKVSVFAYKNGIYLGWCGEFSITSTSSGIQISSLNSEQKKSMMNSYEATSFPSSLISSSDTFVASTKSTGSGYSTYPSSTKKSSSSYSYSTFDWDLYGDCNSVLSLGYSKPLDGFFSPDFTRGGVSGAWEGGNMTRIFSIFQFDYYFQDYDKLFLLLDYDIGFQWESGLGIYAGGGAGVKTNDLQTFSNVEFEWKANAGIRWILNKFSCRCDVSYVNEIGWLLGAFVGYAF